MRCFVTGGSGFVGSNLIALLIKEGYDVVAMARSEDASNKIKSLGATPVSADMSEADRLVDDLRGCTAVFHLASASEFWRGYEYAYEINVRGTEKLVDAAKKAGVQRFIYISTAAIILQGKPVYDADERLSLPHLPKGAYRRTKYQAEQVVLNSNAEDFQTVIVRPPLVWGKGSVVKFLVEASREDKLMWFNHGKYKVPIIHVKNLCHAILLAYRQGKPGEMYYVIDSEHVVFRDFLTRILATQGLAPPTKNMNRSVALAMGNLVPVIWKILRKKSPPPMSAEMIHMQATEYTVSDAKAREELGYEDVITYEEGLEELKSGF